MTKSFFIQFTVDCSFVHSFIDLCIYIKVERKYLFVCLTFAAVNDATSAIDPTRVVYHISVVSKLNQAYLQLIIVDRYEYDEVSTKLMEILRPKVLNKLFESESRFLFLNLTDLS